MATVAAQIKQPNIGWQNSQPFSVGRRETQTASQTMDQNNLIAKTLLAGVLLASVAAAHATTIRVGADGSCDTDDLSSAVTGASSGDTILIANNQSYDGIELSISNKSLTIVGGYDSCSSLDPDGRTVLGRGTDGAINISVGNQIEREVNLVDLEITGVDTESDGAAIRISNRTHLKLENVHIHGNTTDGKGGAIFMNGTAGQRLSIPSPGTEITDNQANLGGAVYCDETGGGLFQNGLVDLNAALISGNRAVVDEDGNGGEGGGIYLQDCNLNLRAGAVENGQIVAGIHANAAQRNGGGIAVRGSSELVFEAASPSDSRPLIDGNEADIGGGGIFCRGSSSDSDDRPEITMTAGLIHANEAREGGGLHLISCNADIYASGPDQGIQNNLARRPEGETALASGGGIRVERASVLNIDGGDRSHSPADQPVYLSGNGAENNGGAMLILTFIDDSPEVTLTDVRIEGNEGFGAPVINHFGGPASLTIQSSEDGNCRVANGPDGCSQIINNRQTSNALTGVFQLQTGTQASIERTVIRGNSANSLVQTLEGDTTAPEVDIASSLIVDNQVVRLIDSEGYVRIAWTTIAGHESSGIVPQPLFNLRFDSEDNAVAPRLDLISSIIWEPEFGESAFFDLDPGSEVNLAHCLVTHDPNAVIAAAATDFRVIGDDPLFGGPARGDWTVGQNSPAFQCDRTFYDDEPDLLGAQRGVLTSLPLADPVIFTAGAYSTRSADGLFSDRFEAD